MQNEIIINAFCLIVIAIIILSMYLQKQKKDEAALRFLILLYGAVAYCAINIVLNVVEGCHIVSAITYIFNLLAFLAIDFIVLSFSGYLSSLIKRARGTGLKPVNIVSVSTYLRSIVCIILFFSGTLFTIDENGVYQDGSLVYIPYLISAVIMFELVFLVFYYRKYFTKRQLIVIIVYQVLPVSPIIIELFTGIYSLTGISLTLAILLVYILLQNTTIEQGIEREIFLEELSTTDQLTSLGNRRSYYNCIKAIKDSEKVGVIFADVNGLKYTNDHFGHAAGDELLIKFSNILKTQFNKNVFRISGDEFVVIVPNVDHKEFETIFAEVHKIVKENNYIASMGSSYGAGF